VFDRMQDLTDQAHAELVKAPHNAQQIAASLNLTFVDQPAYVNGQPLPIVGNDPQVGASLATLKPNEVSPVMQAGNRLIVAVLFGVNPPHPPQLSEVEPQVRADWIKLHATDAVKEKSARAAELLKQNGGDIQAAAKAVGAEVKSTDFFGRSGAAQGIGPANVITGAFEKPIGAIIGPLSVPSQTIIAKVVDRQSADMSKFPAERDSIVLQLKAKRANDRLSLLQDSVLTDLIRRGKVKKHQPVIDRLIAQYRS
jgi:hypothetical protein